MDMPCICSGCSELVELNDLNFCVRGFCDCGPYGRCDHGICDDCKDLYEDEEAA